MSPCSVPPDFIVGSLQAGLAEAGVTCAEVVAGDLWELPPEMSTPIVDEMIAGHDFPMVLVEDHVVCYDGVDVGSVVEALPRG